MVACSVEIASVVDVDSGVVASTASDALASCESVVAPDGVAVPSSPVDSVVGGGVEAASVDSSAVVD